MVSPVLSASEDEAAKSALDVAKHGRDRDTQHGQENDGVNKCERRTNF